MNFQGIIIPTHVQLSGDLAVLEGIRKLYYFKDKSVDRLISRFYKRIRYMRLAKQIHGEEDWIKKQEAELLAKQHVYCCEFRGDILWVPIGLLPVLREFFQNKKLVCSFLDHRCFDIPKRKMIGEKKKLRPPQVIAIDRFIQSPDRVGMTRMATGVGKTIVGQEVIRHFGVRSIFLVPSRPIMKQTISRFQKAFGKNNVGYIGDGKKKHGYVTVATYQSVFASDPKEFDEYRLMMADEVHHIAADTFYEVAEKRLLNCVYRFGLTADEERADGGTICVEAASGPVLYSYEAPEAIRDGFLAKPTFIIYEIFNTEGHYIDWIKDENDNRVPNGIIQSECFLGDDYDLSYKNWILGNDRLTMYFAQLAQSLAADGKSVLILIDEKEHGEKFQNCFKELGCENQFVYGGSPNDYAIDLFNQRKLLVLVATSTLGEGADTVATNVLIDLLNRKNPKQANGRALRNDPDPITEVPRKPTALIIHVDFPTNPTLHRISLLRCEVNEQCGEVVKQRLF